MAADLTRIKQHIQNFAFKDLFLDELGWDDHGQALSIQVDGESFRLSAIAQKRGMIAFLCQIPQEVDFPLYQLRRKIESKVVKSAREHMIVFTDTANTRQVWQWVKREPGKPSACREHQFYKGQSGEALAQKLQSIVFNLAEEENLTLVDVFMRVQSGLDVEKITKRFYERFKKEHDAFLKLITGIPDDDFHQWYASVMLNRLMFIYFLQKKGFLDRDENYLRVKLALMKQKGKDLYYNQFLCPLFFDGFAKPENQRSQKNQKLLGNVPYLNGGIFQKHQIEQHHGKTIEVPDKAFEKLFDFFDAYHWHLDERPMRADNEINPDVLGYIFEKYINQKQMGAYYTKEDITEYISRNTIVPRLVDMAREKCKVAFEGDQSVWNLLRTDPDRYFFDAVKKGVNKDLPKYIADGTDNVAKRTRWNEPAAEDLALPTEVWRETIARRQRYEEVRAKLTKGELRSINDLITYNLDIRQFAQDVIEKCEGPELLRAVWRAIVGRIPEKSNEKFQQGISILDPTCGSGAFLFAALNVLEPLYEACLDRMQAFIAELENNGSKGTEKYSDFKKILAEVGQHHNPKYFIYKSIIINNLFGVDIMEEAVEICKLRLFLKLVAQIENADDLEPLPDIDFNIRAGNTLVGFASLDEVKKSMEGDWIKQQALPEIEEKAEDVDRLYQRFRQMQIKEHMDSAAFAEHKLVLETRLSELEDELNEYLADRYVIKPSKKKEYEAWRNSYHPFHWLIDFYGIMSKGGFDVIIGNPPYVEYSKIRKQYEIQGYSTEPCGNLYAYVLERCVSLQIISGRMGMIVQLPIVCTDRMKPLQKAMFDVNSDMWFSNFDDRPARLFDGLEHIRATIILTCKRCGPDTNIFSTNYNRWYSDIRPVLFDLLQYVSNDKTLIDGAIPKIGNSLAKSIYERINFKTQFSDYFSSNSNRHVYFHNAPQYWTRAMDFVPYFWNERDGEKMSTQVKVLPMRHKEDVPVGVCVLNSSLFYWWFLIHSDCRHLNMREIERFPINLGEMPSRLKDTLKKINVDLMADYKDNAERKECSYKTTGKVIYDEFKPNKSKSIFDQIDNILSEHYGFTNEELDFIINYDIKYRMGKELNSDEDED